MEWTAPESWSAYGETGWLARWENEETFARLLPAVSEKLESAGPPGLAEYVPGFQTLLLLFDRAVSRTTPEEWWERLTGEPAGEEGRMCTLSVRYGGPDLADFAAATGLPVAEVIRRHTAPIYTVRLLGFSPGFPYLGPLDPALHLARKATPRTRIEPGSVAIGGSHTGIYPVASPGGWHILGKTDAVLFHPEAAREEPPDPARLFLLRPGDRVRFVAEEQT